ncbi:sensor histidine kinase [Pacificibacter marinus]|uniref:sensor histidine kinase n=1 Tax=Pacificibacter marinus TaxID=658057 RepID=UPI001C065A0B|nr:histidine kinase N-terminal 7TM domain-containing protein [Pacificibacter marinus]MBU2867752.1 ATPase [Pacificibacter marinus]
MSCFEGVSANPVFWFVSAISAIAAFVLLWVIKYQNFKGKVFYALTFIAMIWTLIMVGLEVVSDNFACQMLWATMAWLGNALLPVAWCFFVFAYVDNAAWLKTRAAGATLAVVPISAFALAATNQWHHLVYTDASAISLENGSINYIHGHGFYVIIASLYTFVFAALLCLARAFTRAKQSAWPLLSVFIVITLTPLTANAGYVVFDLTVFGLDPTAFMFTLGILAFTWILVRNKTMDMAFVGQSGLANAMSEPVIMIDRNNKIFRINKAAKDNYFIQNSTHFVNELRANIENINLRETLSNLNTGSRIYEPRIQEIESPLDPSRAILGWSITFVDVTENIAIRGALEEALQRADEASRAKDEFISVVSHELRTPLTSLIGGLKLARSGKLGETTASIQSMLDIAHRNSIRLSRLVDNILLAQKIDINALVLEHEPVDLGQILKESFKENQMFAAEQGVQFALDQIDNGPTITGDAFAIRQVIDNLISNAIKFSNDHGTVTGGLTTLNGQARLSITNSGQGIPKGMESQIFGRFEQVKNSNQHSTQGSGLGLHISKKLVNQMAGDIFYQSEEDQVTTFYVTFPLTEIEQI